MKLCIPSTGEDLRAMADKSFGRAAYFTVIDLDTMRIRCLRNLPLLPGQGSGQVTAELISLLGVEGVVAEYIGANAFHVLRAAGIRIFEGTFADDSVQEVVNNFQRGAYQEAADSHGRRLCGPAPVTGSGRCGAVP